MISIKRNKYDYRISFYSKKQDKLAFGISNRDYLFESLARSKRSVIELGINNTWSHFITITCDARKINRYDYDLVLKKIIKQFNNFKFRFDSDFKYLLIPELHSDGAIHFHGLIFISNVSRLIYLFFDYKSHSKVYYDNWLLKNIGANRFIPIVRDSNAVVYYICKYISKNNTRVFSHSYFCSRGLKKSVKVFNNESNTTLESYIFKNDIKPIFSNDFVSNYSVSFECFNELFPFYAIAFALFGDLVIFDESEFNYEYF